MQLKSIVKTSIATLLAGGVGGALAAAITVLPTQVVNTATPGQWYRVNGGGSATANVTGTYAPAGESGSLQFNGTAGTASKMDVQMSWNIDTAASNGFTVGNLTALSYDWMRAGGTSSGHYMPALRLLYDLDGNSATTTDRGMLIWEAVYNGYDAAAVSAAGWKSTDVLAGNLWQVTTDPHSNAILAALGVTQNNQINIYNYKLTDWTNGSLSKTESAADGGTTGDTLTANTVIYGINVGIGSGWNGTFLGAVDHITLGFGGNSTTWNFETQALAVPEPGSLALAGLALAAVGFVGRRRRA